MQAYLFVHFKEKETPDGEQVYFAVSSNGYDWESIHDGNPILVSEIGERGVRDCTIIRTKDNRFVLIATDLSLARNFKEKYHSSWEEISQNGSKNLVLWESDDLVHWSAPRLLSFASEPFGCLWAPDILFDTQQQEYILHWSSSHAADNYADKAIYYSRTKDFSSFSTPQVLYKKEGSRIIDSAMYEHEGKFYLFVKNETDPKRIVLLSSSHSTGPFVHMEAFDEEMKKLEEGQYEAPTAVQLEDKTWCLFLDFYGTVKEKQGYVPFVSSDIASGVFKRADQSFSFPHGFKHGTILTITPEECHRLQKHDFT